MLTEVVHDAINNSVINTEALKLHQIIIYHRYAL